MILQRLAAAMVLLCGSGCVYTAKAEQLERVVIVERHGIRAPSQSPEELAKYAKHPWPSWPVAPGDLTPHGALNLKLLGSWMRTNYARLGVLPSLGCPDRGAIFVWADSRDSRTSESGDALLSGLAPDCGVAAHHRTAKTIDPIFDATASGACMLDGAKATDSITHSMPEGAGAPVPGYAKAMAHLEDILGQANTQSACSPKQENCFPNGQNRLVVNSEMAKISGPLAKASMLTEALSLQYDEGLQPDKLGWGPLNLAGLEEIAPLHNGYNNLTRKNPSVARHNGALMAQAVAAALQGKSFFPGQGDKAARVTIIFGHDTTLQNMAGFFGLDWALKDQPDNTPPGGALIFEVYKRDKTADDRVRMFVLYQTADQLRQALPLDQTHGPSEVEVQPASCMDAAMHSCSLASILQIVGKNVPAECKDCVPTSVTRP